MTIAKHTTNEVTSWCHPTSCSTLRGSESAAFASTGATRREGEDYAESGVGAAMSIFVLVVALLTILIAVRTFDRS